MKEYKNQIREIGLSLGSNQGDRLDNLRGACEDLARHDDINVLAKSRIYETEPVGVPEKYKDEFYYNAFIVIETGIMVSRLYKICKDIELKYGRPLKYERNSPRPLDIDIIYVDNLRFNTIELTIPHAKWHERRFVVKPFADIRPDMVLPGQTKTVREILKGLPDEPYVRFVSGTRDKF